MRLYDPLVSRQRDARLMIPHLKRRGVWREVRLGGLNGIVLRCDDVRNVVMAMASQGLYCYHDVGRLVARKCSVFAQSIRNIRPSSPAL
jgi:hypothetical protein